MDFFKYFHFGLKRKYKYLLFGVVFALLVFNLLSVFGYCDYVESYTGSFVGNLSTNNVITTGDSSLRYIKLVKGHKYNIKNISGARHTYAFSDDLPNVGVIIYGRSILEINGVLSFVADKDYYISSSMRFEYEDLGIQNYNGVMWSLNDTLSTDNIWIAFKTTIPYISVVVISCFGYLIISKSVDKFFINK